MTVWTGGNLVAVGRDWNPTVAVAVGFQSNLLFDGPSRSEIPIESPFDGSSGIPLNLLFVF